MITTVRTALRSELAAIVEIEQQSPTAAHWQIGDYERAIQDSGHLVLVASREEQVLGFLVASIATQEWELENIAVVLNARRRGIGRDLINALIFHARTAGALEIRQEVRASNLPAQKLGQAVGFMAEGRRRCYYRDPEEDALLFKYLVKQA